MERFSKLNPANQQLPVCETVNDISANTMKRVQRFRQLESELSDLIKDTKNSIPQLEDRYRGKTSSNTDIVSILQ